MRALAWTVTALLAIAAVPGAHAQPDASSAAAKDGWRAEFEAVCSRTQDSMTLTVEDLRALLRRCEALKPVVEGLDETQRKVYSRRLEGCRSLYQFVLDYKLKG